MRHKFIRNILILLISLAALNVQSQTIQLTAGSVTNCAGDIVVPINVTDLTDVAAISLVLDFDSTVLVYNGYQNLNTALNSGINSINGTENQFIFSWTNTTAASISNEVLVEILFTTNGGSSDLNWDLTNAGSCEFSDVNGNALDANFIDGLVDAPGQVVNITQQPNNTTTFVGSNASIGFAQTGAESFQWQESTDNGVQWLDLVNGAAYGGSTSRTLTIYSPASDMDGNQYRCIVAGGCPPPDTTDVVLLSVNPIPPTVTITAHDVNSCAGDILVPITVNDFTNVGAFSLTLDFDTTKLSFNDYIDLNDSINASEIFVNTAGNQILITWASLNPATIASDDTLLQLVVHSIGSNSYIRWNTEQGNCEFADENGITLASIYHDAYVSAPGNPPTIYNQSNDLDLVDGESSSIFVSATYATTYQWQHSVDFGASWQDLTNDTLYSGTNNYRLYFTDVALHLDGYQYRCIVSSPCPPNDTSEVVSLFVSEPAPIIKIAIPNKQSCTETSSVPVSVEDFYGVSSVSLVINYDSAAVEYAGISNVHPALASGMLVDNANGTQITFSWISVNPVDIGSDSLFFIDFLSDGGSSNLTWDLSTPGNCEFSNAEAQIIESEYVNGNISVELDNLEVSFTGLNTEYCANDQLFTLVGAPSGGVFLGNGIDGSAFNPYLAGQGMHEIVYAYTNNLGCVFTDTQWVNVNPLPFVSLGENQVHCEGESIDLSVDDSFIAYEWSTGATDVNSVSISENSDVFVLLTDSLGCSGYSDTVNFIFNPLPLVGLEDSIMICQGDTAEIYAGNFDFYLWNNGFNGSTLQTDTAGTFTVQVGDSAGCFGYDTIVVMVNQLPEAEITVLDSDCGSANGSASINVLSGSGNYNYAWSTDPVQTGQTATNLGLGVYYVTISDDYCSNVYEFTVNEVGAPTVTIESTNDTICLGDSVTLTAMGASTYHWEPLGDTNSVIVVFPSQTTNYIVNGSNGGCSAYAEKKIVVLTSPEINLADSIIACQGDIVTLSGPPEADSYLWSTVDTSMAINVSNSGSYWLMASIASCVAYDTVHVVFNELPVVDLGNDIEACAGESRVLKVDAYSEILWSNGSTADSIVVTESGEYFVTVMENGCENSDTIQVLFNEVPTLSITTTETACGDSTAMAVVTATGGSGLYTYLWNTNPIQTTDTAFNLKLGYYTVEVNDGHCAASASATIKESNAPIVAVTLQDSVLCVGESTMVYLSGAENYTWNNTVGLSFISDTVIEAQPTSTQNYELIGETSGCSTQELFTIVVNELPVVDAGANDSICYGESITLLATGAESYVWSNGTLTDTNTVSPLLSTTYYVTATENSCTASDSIFVSVISLPEIPTANNVGTCKLDSIPVLIANGVNVKWYADSLLSELLYEGNEFVSNDTLIGSYTYYITQTTNECESYYNTVTLDINPGFLFAEDTAICQGDSVVWRGQTLMTAGIYYDQYISSTGCDSVYELVLYVHPEYFMSQEEYICEGDSIMWQGQYYFNAGTYYMEHQTQSGCDSIYELVLQTNPAYNVLDVASICMGDSLYWQGNYYHTSGTYLINDTTVTGCDSIFELQLEVFPMDTTYLAEGICGGDSIVFYDTVIYSEGSYEHTLSSVMGCDSLLVLNVYVNDSYEFIETASICDGDEYLWQGNTYTSAGDYSAAYTTQSGCDSIYYLSLSVDPSYFVGEQYEICSGASISWQGSDYSETGLYYVNYVTETGCDSIFELDLTVYDLPDVDLGSDVVMIQNELITLDAGSGFVNYLWNNGETTQTIELFGFELGLGTYEYSVWVSDVNACENGDTVMVTVQDGTGVAAAANAFIVYPNPVNEALTVENNGQIAAIKLLDVAGQVLYVSEEFEHGNVIIPMQAFDQGTYLLSVQNKQGATKVIKVFKK